MPSPVNDGTAFGLPIGAVNKDNKPICGAYKCATRSYCQMPPLANGRCAKHGGFNTDRPKGKRGDRFLSKNLYDKYLNPEEANMYGQLQVGTLEQEIKLLRIQLVRLLEAQHNWEISRDQVMAAIQDADGTIRTPAEIYKALTIDGYEYKRQEGIDNRGQPVDQTDKKLILKKRDYKQEIKSCIRLIGELEVKHKELMKQDIPDSERIAQIASALRSFTGKADATVPSKSE